MIRTLRRKFIFSAMTAFAILLAILVSGITLINYLQVERHADNFMHLIVEEQPPQDVPMPREGINRRNRPTENPIAYYSVEIEPDGGIGNIKEKGVWEPDMDGVRSYTQQIIASGKTEGRLDGYKFLLHSEDSGSMRLILLDMSMQMQMLANVVRTALLLGMACLGLLLLILLPISTRVVRSYARHIEKQKQFITNAGHEIKTPVAIILSNIDAMELIQGENKWSRNIRSQTDRLSALLQRLLFMSRIDEKSMVLPMQMLELSALLKAELETYKPMLSERSLQLHCGLEREIRLKGNREYLQQMIHMLLDNAVQYANEGGEIRISMELRRRRMRLLFENTVENLPECAPEDLFDRFYRGDSARTQSGGGYGIGLSAARAIAEMHQGRITAEYADGNIIRFAVELPV